jgi:hypothetical protein
MFGQFTPHRQPPATPHPPDQKELDLHIDLAAYHIHRAICVETGADLDWTDAPLHYRTSLRRSVIRMVETMEGRDS